MRHPKNLVEKSSAKNFNFWYDLGKESAKLDALFPFTTLRSLKLKISSRKRHSAFATDCTAELHYRYSVTEVEENKTK